MEQGGVMRRAVVALMCGISLVVYYTALSAQQLPKSGTFTVQSGWKAIGETTQVAEGRTYGFGSFWGVVFNDKGSGPLHWGPVVCPYTLEMLGSALKAQGQCAWSDADGDKIFTDWTGSMPPNSQFEGLNTITGGTGKYTGVQGKAPFHCKSLNASGQWACTQQFEYRLP
jgi:hypothetical protein